MVTCVYARGGSSSPVGALFWSMGTFSSARGGSSLCGVRSTRKRSRLHGSQTGESDTVLRSVPKLCIRSADPFKTALGLYYVGAVNEADQDVVGGPSGLQRNPSGLIIDPSGQQYTLRGNNTKLFKESNVLLGRMCVIDRSHMLIRGSREKFT